MADFESALSELGVALAATDTKLSSSLAEILGVAIPSPLGRLPVALDAPAS